MGTQERIIRPAAVLPEREACALVALLERNDVSRGGLWNASTSLWQRYSGPWDGLAGTRGHSDLVGSIAVMYDRPARHEITIYKVTMSDQGLQAGWTVERLCDDALAWVGLTLPTCPRADLLPPPPPDPFRPHVVVPAARSSLDNVMYLDRARSRR